MQFYKDYLFFDEETGENFFVETDSLASAVEIAREYFDEPTFVDVYTSAEAEVLGFDTY